MILGRLATGPAVLAAAATVGLIAASVSGCAPMMVSGTPDQNTLARAGYVATMLSNSSASGPQTQGDVMAVITNYGGGYVTDASLSGAAGSSQKLTLSVVLGGGSVRDSMQGETDMKPSGIGCFTYTVGYYGYSGTESQVTCPSSLTTGLAQATATRQISVQIAAARYDSTITTKTVPTTLAAAVHLFEFSTPAGAIAPPAPPGLADVTAADFATGTDAVQHRPDAALAVPQPAGGCIYVSYRWIQASWVGGGSAGTSDSAVTRAWAAPTDAPCTGTAALSAGTFLTADRNAGG
ncbi:hypothetical protein KDL01_08160 [Actinospica durhamensis]|uniref:Lipoprotein n=1 Tax=Actinospica durhamensis TaxID=1508375 RepID=A0A941ILP1_9ACTN|nr:hypothetical protein [Actinospica durhamensis]MBR7833235.1 hypothetical protein [Actinospica durhamensis]